MLRPRTPLFGSMIPVGFGIENTRNKTGTLNWNDRWPYHLDKNDVLLTRTTLHHAFMHATGKECDVPATKSPSVTKPASS